MEMLLRVVITALSNVKLVDGGPVMAHANPQTDTKQASLDEARVLLDGMRKHTAFLNSQEQDAIVDAIATALSSLRQEIAAKDAELVKANMLACANAEDAADESERAAKIIDFAARRLAAKDANIKMLGEQMVTERLHGYELLERAERAEAQLAEVDAHRRKVLAENERLLNGFIEKERQLAEANKALDEVVGCFDAAYAEGLQERLNDEVERDPGSLHDLITRRLLYAFSATRRARASGEKQ